MARPRKPKRDTTPTVDDYIRTATTLATTLRKALTTPKSVKRSRLERVLKDFEKCDETAIHERDRT